MSERYAELLRQAHETTFPTFALIEDLAAALQEAALDCERLDWIEAAGGVDDLYAVPPVEDESDETMWLCNGHEGDTLRQAIDSARVQNKDAIEGVQGEG